MTDSSGKVKANVPLSAGREIKDSCPRCGKRSVVARIDPRSGMFEKCLTKDCGYVMDLEENEGW